MNFVPLHINTSYSLLSGSIKLDALFETLLKREIDTCAITDINTMLAFPIFNNLCKKNKIKPIFGLDINVEGDLLTLLVKNEKGYQNLIKISYLVSKIEDLKFDDIKKYLSDLILIISSEQSSLFSQNILNWPKLLKKYDSLLKDDFYVGIENYSTIDKNIEELRSFLKKYPFNFVAFPNIKYLKEDQAINLEILNKIKDRFVDPFDINKDTALKGKYYFYDKEIIDKLYTDEEILNTHILTAKIDFVFDKIRGKMLRFDENKNSYELLKNLCENSLFSKNLNTKREYVDRLNMELNVINSMGYNDYFLIVQDYVNYAKNNNILVAPGRGSAAGSLVAYLLNITEVDPLKYNLLFERFLNKDRISMPDIDIDFENDKRDLIIEYLKNKYGKDRVCQIVTIQSLKAKQSIRDIGRCYAQSNKVIDNISSYLINDKLTLLQSYSRLPSFQKIILDDVGYQKIFKLALKIEGLPRQLGIHAAGVILNDEPIINGLPLIYNKDMMSNVTQYEMDYLEDQGFLKMDLLALTNLSTIHLILNLIKKNKGIDLKFTDIPIDEPEIYSKLINKGLTMGLFQIESDGMNEAIKLIKPHCFNDIVDTIAVFRPGAMESISLFAKRKNEVENNPNYKIFYYSDDLKDILSETYGIIVYQEQIMQITQKVANFSLSQADIFRRAISKKKMGLFDKYKNDFISGAINNGYDKKIANEIFDLLEKFAGYGFNKSHSVSYSMITTRMAYLKLKYPQEFYVALLQTTNNSNDTKFKKFVSEINTLNIKIKLPNINVSEKMFVVEDNSMVMPLTSIKGITSDTVNKILFERKQNGPFSSLTSFMVRTNEYGLNKTQVEKLIKSGCFDIFTSNRQSMLDKLDICIQYANVKSKQQLSLNFTTEDDIVFDSNTYEDKAQKIADECELLGIPISDNPVIYQKNIAKTKYKNIILSFIDDIKLNSEAFILVFVNRKRVYSSNKSNKTTVFLNVFDEKGTMLDCTMFNETYNLYGELIKENETVILQGKMNLRNNSKSFIINKVFSLKENSKKENLKEDNDVQISNN